MKQEDKQVLFQQKIVEGKSAKQAWKEITRDEDFFKKFDETKRGMRSEVTRILKETARVQKILDKTNSRLKTAMTRDLKRESEVSSGDMRGKGKFANTKMLVRIMHHLEEVDTAHQTDIKENCMISREQTSDALAFLSKYKFITKLRINTAVVYQLQGRKYNGP